MCALATPNYRAQAVTLLDSLKRHHPEASLYLLEVDDFGGPSAGERLSGVTLLRPQDVLSAERLEERLGWYEPFEFVVSLKAALLAHALDRGHAKAICLDVDTWLLQPLTTSLDALDHAAVLLTPHALGPLPEDALNPNARDLVFAGVFNAGFLGVRESAEARRFLAWWDERLHADCRHDQAAGLFYEQKWLDEVPARFEGVEVLSDAGYNVAHWNLDERRLTCRDGAYMVGETPLVLFHFSGFDPHRPACFSKYRNRPLAYAAEVLAALHEAYASCLLANGYDQAMCFSNGEPFDACALSLLWEARRQGHAFAAPLDVDAAPSYYAWLNEPMPGARPLAGRVRLTRYLGHYHRTQRLLRELFPDALGQHQRKYLRWLSLKGHTRLPGAFLASALGDLPVAHEGLGSRLRWLLVGLPGRWGKPGR